MISENEVNREELKKWAEDKIVELIGHPINVVYKKHHKTKWGATKWDKEKNEYVIMLYFGSNLEDIKDELDVENYKDTVLHEIAHAKLGLEVCKHHSHDKLWKEEAKKVGALPYATHSKFSFKLMKMGESFKILDGEWVIKKNNLGGAYPYIARYGSKVIMGDTIVECPKCKRKWVVKLKDDVNYYCEYDEVKCDIVSETFNDEEEKDE